MQTKSNKFIILSLIAATLLGGCKKNKKSVDAGKGSFFSKSSKSVDSKRAAHGQDTEPFDLDSNPMKTFALDDNLPKHQSTKQADEAVNPVFSWENTAAEESKQNFKTLYFDFDKDFIKPGQEKALSDDINQAKKLIKLGKVIVIEGHACHSAGSAIYNLALSEKRARFVAQKCAAAGIDSTNIKIAPRGQEMPVVKDGNRQQQAANRRVEMFAIDTK